MENNTESTLWFKSTFWPALIDTFLIVVFTLQPTIYLSLNRLRIGQNQDFSSTFLSGDMLLYSISFLSASYLVYNDARVKVSDWKDNLNKFALGSMVIISMLYAMMKGDDKTELSFAKWVSIIFLVYSFIVFVRSQILTRTPTTDVAQERRDEQQTIEDNLV